MMRTTLVLALNRHGCHRCRGSSAAGSGSCGPGDPRTEGFRGGSGRPVDSTGRRAGRRRAREIPEAR
jgi:hypothetical protein